MIRALIFNTIYYLGTLVIGILILPSLLLPHRPYIIFIRGYFRWVYLVERVFLGLDYVVLGREYLPITGPYIIAAKHQSAYETLKLPLLFDEPVVIVKRSLLMIPFWGWYAAKAGMIGIDRGKPRAALAQMQNGVQDALARGRIVVIFPQGTRVDVGATTTDKPYKRGIYQLARDNNVPVIPLALNSGLYWPRNSFLKRPGRVTFRFLPALSSNQSEEDFMTALENMTESASQELAQAQAEPPPAPKQKFWTLPNTAMIVFTAVIPIYTALWFGGAALMTNQLQKALNDPNDQIQISGPTPKIVGFPGAYRITWAGKIKSTDLTMSTPSMTITFWPIPGTSVDVTMPKGLVVKSPRLRTFEATQIKADYFALSAPIPVTFPTIWIKAEVQKLADRGVVYRLHHISLRGLQTTSSPLDVTGRHGQLMFDTALQPQATMNVTITGLSQVTDKLVGSIKDPLGQSMARGALSVLMGQKARSSGQPGDVMIQDLKLKNGSVYVGPLKIGSIGRFYWPVVDPRK